MAIRNIDMLRVRLIRLWENVGDVLTAPLNARPQSSPQTGDESTRPECDDCGDTLRELDRSGHSTTYTCTRCCECYLGIDRPELACLIWLRRFHQRRGEGPAQRPLTDLRMATRLVESLNLDCWPSPATVVDFGIDSPSHLGALQHAIQGGVTAYDLDRVMGDGQAITHLVRAVTCQPYRHVAFRTAYDGFAEHEEEDGER